VTALADAAWLLGQNPLGWPVRASRSGVTLADRHGDPRALRLDAVMVPTSRS